MIENNIISTKELFLKYIDFFKYMNRCNNVNVELTEQDKEELFKKNEHLITIPKGWNKLIEQLFQNIILYHPEKTAYHFQVTRIEKVKKLLQIYWVYKPWVLPHKQRDFALNFSSGFHNIVVDIERRSNRTCQQCGYCEYDLKKEERKNVEYTMHSGIMFTSCQSCLSQCFISADYNNCWFI